MLYRGMDTKVKPPPGRFDAFKRWADQENPGLLDSPEMEIPNNPRRRRELLTEWREGTGLPAIE